MTSSIPSSIPFLSIDLGHRARTQHENVLALANDIAEAGLIQPIVIVEKTPDLVLQYESEFKLTLDSTRPYLLTAGGRRSAALAELGCNTLYHATTCDPERPGFILRDEAPLHTQLILELKENLNRDQMDWRDMVKSVVRAFRLAERQALDEGESLASSTFGAMLGVGATDMWNAVRIYDHFIANPRMYENCQNMHQALSVRLQAESTELTRLLVTRSMSKSPTLVSSPTSILPQVSPETTAVSNDRLSALLPGHSLIVTEGQKENVIPLSQMFLHTNGLDFMAAQPDGFCDHIITDPDYAISLDSINSTANNRPGLMQQGIRQASVEDSLADLRRFFPLAYRAIAEKGFLIFWYAIDHHHLLQSWATEAGFDVQPHPLIWQKIDFRARSNGAPRLQWPKSYELAMVCRKPGTVLAQVQNSAVFSTDEQSVTKKLNHPFAKPFGVWKWLMKAVSIPGQIVFDPFVGSGSMPIAAIDLGLRPLGTELSDEIYHHLLVNLQAHYRSALGPEVKFK